MKNNTYEVKVELTMYVKAKSTDEAELEAIESLDLADTPAGVVWDMSIKELVEVKSIAEGKKPMMVFSMVDELTQEPINSSTAKNLLELVVNTVVSTDLEIQMSCCLQDKLKTIIKELS